MLGWVFWFASPYIRAWHRHRVVLACTPYGWVNWAIEGARRHNSMPGRDQVSGEASKKSQPKILLKRGVYLLFSFYNLFSTSFSWLTLELLECLRVVKNTRIKMVRYSCLNKSVNMLSYKWRLGLYVRYCVVGIRFTILMQYLIDLVTCLNFTASITCVIKLP